MYKLFENKSADGKSLGVTIDADRFRRTREMAFTETLKYHSSY